jgi:hypothetical protein
MSVITIHESANAELLSVGDLIAIYAGNDTPSHVARVDEVRHLTGTTEVTTEQGIFDLADDDQVGIVAWAPLPGNRKAEGALLPDESETGPRFTF